MLNMILTLLGAINIILRHPLHALGLGKATFNSLEVAIISQFQELLNESEGSILETQLDEINCIDRVYSPKTVIGFSKINGLKYDLRRARKFDDPREDFVLKKLEFLLDGERYRAKLYVVNGNLYSIEFTANIRSIIGRSDVRFK